MSTNFARVHGADIRVPPLEAFVAWAHRMLDPATAEKVRRAVEPRLLALGVFEPFELRDPALRAWPADEMTKPGGASLKFCRNKSVFEYICLDKYHCGNRISAV